ncbi:MAG: NnrU family protein [Robiginitomaculum sp.]|nr:MAG: NnrU family protein [Robiginitomaculum sp.]
MSILWAGLAIFIGVHLMPALAPVKTGLQSRLGENGYKGAFSLVSAIGLGLIIWGMMNAPRDPVFVPADWAHSAAIIAMPLVMILLAAAHMKGRIRQITRHPMMLATLIWAALHYAANGDRASIWLFGSFAVFAVFSIVTGNMRGAASSFEIKPKHDFIAIGAGLLVYVAFLFLHPILFGVKLF